MARVDNYAAKDADRIINEHDRLYENYKNYVDRNRSHLNFGYGELNTDALKKKIVDRCFEIMGDRQMQEQTNVFSEWVVTYPATECDEAKDSAGRTYNKPRDPAHVEAFFAEVWRFMQDRYGAENVMAGYVHMDETTPHIHAGLVPEATSRKTGKRTVSSASLMTPHELKNFHRDLAKHMQAVFGDRARDWILNGRTKGDYSVGEMKERQKRERALEARERAVEGRERAAQEEAREILDSAKIASEGLLSAAESDATEIRRKASTKLGLAEKIQAQAAKRKAEADEAEKRLNDRRAELDRREWAIVARERELGARETAVSARERKQDEKAREFQSWEDKLEAQARALDRREQEQAQAIKRGREAMARDAGASVRREQPTQHRYAGLGWD